MAFLPGGEEAQKLIGQLRGAIRLLRHSPREFAAVFVALSAFGLARLLEGGERPEPLVDVLDASVWTAITRWGALSLYMIAAAGLIWVVFRLWRQLAPPLEPAPRVSPFAIKGPMAFAEYDGDLFRRLGREEHIAKLLSWILDPQIGLIVVMGESGVGKTSLLRAGLHNVLKEQVPPIAYHYWEAVPEKPLASLLVAIQATWPEVATEPAPQRKLTELYSMGSSSRRHVVILDQFEQLSPHDGSHRPIFQLMRHVVERTGPPHGTTYIIAFRRSYDPVWRDFELEELADYRPTMMSLRLLRDDQAKNIFAVIADAAGFTLDGALVDDLIRGMRREDATISPVDVGVALLALSERANVKADRHLSRGDYRIAGGTTGLLAGYVSDRLDRYRSDERSVILKLLLDLADLESDQRLASGLSPQHLAGKSGVPATAVQRYLNDLASPRVRLVEELPSGTYRLPHERLIPALRQLAGVMLAEADQAGRAFNLAYQTWIAGQRGRAHLLSGQRLRRVLLYRSQLHWGEDRIEREQFLDRSVRWHWQRRVIVGALAACLLLVGHFGWERYWASQFKGDLSNWRLPGALYDQLADLRSLEIKNDRLTHLRWSYGGLHELSLTAPKLNGLEGIDGYKNLTTLSLDLTGSDVRDLAPLDNLPHLTSLNLDLRDSDEIDLAPLKNAVGLTSLFINFPAGNVRGLASLKGLTGLNALELNLGSAGLNSLAPLEGLTGLTKLTLDLEYGGLTDLTPLKDFPGLNNLDLKMSRLGGGDIDLSPLKELKGLTTLTLSLTGSHIGDLAQIGGLKGLTTLNLNLGGSQVRDLAPLKDLTRLTTLSLDLDGSIVRDLAPLKDLADLTALTLRLDSGQALNLTPLSSLTALTTLSITVREGDMPDLAPLKHLTGLATLTLDLRNTDTRDIAPLADLTNLHSLSLTLDGSDVSDLAPLKHLTGLTDLGLSIGVTQVRDLAPLGQLTDLTALSLILTASHVSDLKPLENLNRLTILGLYLDGSEARDLTPLKRLSGLTDLIIFLEFIDAHDLTPLKELSRLTTLVIGSRNVNMPDLGVASSLYSLDSLSIIHNGSYVLHTLPKSVTALTLKDEP